MTRKEMTEIFAVMTLAWPNAEMFKGGVERLGPTIALWTSTLPDVDYWTAKQAMVKLCRSCKFPPTIAELREAAEAVREDLRRTISHDWNLLKLHSHREGGVEDFLRKLPAGSPLKTAVAAMGGPDALTVKSETGEYWNITGFQDAYTAVIRKDPALTGWAVPSLSAGGKETV